LTDHILHPLRLSELARRVIYAAQALAAATDSDADAAHVLLALARERRSFSSSLLREFSLDAAGLGAALERGNGATPRGLAALLEGAYAHAERLGNHYTGTEHLLLTVSYDPGMAALMADYGADAEALCQRLEQHLAG
jgi:ATP-dependent Clp protease ATP-binding subunit ClpA